MLWNALAKRVESDSAGFAKDRFLSRDTDLRRRNGAPCASPSVPSGFVTGLTRLAGEAGVVQALNNGPVLARLESGVVVWGSACCMIPMNVGHDSRGNWQSLPILFGATTPPASC